MGFTEEEIGHMSYYKWKKLFNHFKAMHNFETRKQIFDIEEDKEVTENDIVYF